MDRFLAQDFCSTIYLSIDSSSRGTDFLVQRWSCQRPETAGQAALGWEVQDLSTRTHQFPKEQKSCSKISQKPGVTRPGGLEGSRPSRADLQGANMSGLPVVSCKPCHRWEQLLNKASYPRNGNIPKSCVLNVVHWFGVHWLCQSSYIDLTLWGARFGWASRLSIPSQGSPPESDRKVSNLFLLHFCMSFTFTFNMARCWICMNLYEHLQSTERTSTSTISSTCGHRRIQSFSRIWNSKGAGFSCSQFMVTLSTKLKAFWNCWTFTSTASCSQGLV